MQETPKHTITHGSASDTGPEQVAGRTARLRITASSQPFRVDGKEVSLAAADIEAERKNGRFDRLASRLACFVDDCDGFDRFRPLIESLNRDLVLLAGFDVRDSLPGVLALTLDGFPEWGKTANKPIDGKECPSVLTDGLLPELFATLRPSGFLIFQSQPSVRGKWVAEAARRAGIPVAWLNASWTDPVREAQCGEPSWIYMSEADVPILCRAIHRCFPCPLMPWTDAPKLHVGCGFCPKAGWLNTDVNPSVPGVNYMDASRDFPFGDDMFSHVYTEHLIEHLSYADARRMLSEALRVLKPGGRLRVATPRLDFLMQVYARPDLPLHRRYIDWSVAHYAPHLLADYPSGQVPAGIIVNLFMHLWEHRFIYDRDTLSALLLQAGFSNLTFERVGESDDPVLRDAERHGTIIPSWANELETMVVEAVKPTAQDKR